MYNFKWYEIGDENPFNKRILDCRSYTQNMISTTKNRMIIETFTNLRSSSGKEYVSKTIENCKVIDTNLIYAHNGTHLEGSCFKAKSMEEKWDIYVYDNYFYFVKSWTGELIFKAFAKICESQILINQIEFNEYKSKDISLIDNNVHFLMMTHAIKKIFPHKVPHNLKTDLEIATYSFAEFGNKCWYATFDNILDTTVKTINK